MAEINTRIVLRHDESADWTTAGDNATLKAGEAAIEFVNGKAKMKVGTAEGQKFADAPYIGGADANVFQVELAADETDIEAAIGEVVGDTELAKGDIAIVKAGIAGDKTSYTSYVWDGSKWVATEGNYSAANVYTNAKITLAGDYGQDSRKDKITSIGNLRLGDEIDAGTSLQDVLKRMLTQTLQPTVSNPVATIKLYNGSATSEAGAVEVGTVFTPRFSASLSAGSYTYGPATGVTATNYAVTSTGRKTVDGATADTEEDSASSASGTFDAFTVDEDTNYKVNVSITHGEGVVAEDNLGGLSNPEKKVTAGTKTDDSTSVTGYRAVFYGYKDSKALDPNALTSAQIRALGVRTSLPSGAKAITTNKMQQMFFAAPKGKYTSIAVANSTNGAPQTVSKVTDVMVEGANGFTAIAYDVFYVDNAGAESGSTTFDVTIS